jgi:RNA polymerase sigma-70 factor (ECF subfamily)
MTSGTDLPIAGDAGASAAQGDLVDEKSPDSPEAAKSDEPELEKSDDPEGDEPPPIEEPGRAMRTAESTSASTSVQKAPDALRPLRLVRVTTPTDDVDHGLVVEARTGNAAAFARLFERHHGRVYAMCRRLLADKNEVDDAVQQTFLEAWRSLPRFEGRSRFSTWITRIAIHTCLGFRRRLRRLLFAADVFGPSNDEGGGVANDVEHGGAQQTAFGSAPPSPLEGAVHQARKKAVDEILLLLSAKKRVVFVLAELEGMTAPEIAEIVEIPEATVRTRLFHARKEFAQAASRHRGFADLFDDASVADGAPRDGAVDDGIGGGP